MKKLLSKIISNITIVEADDGEKTVELYKKEKPDLILMDIQMPLINGYEATGIIRKLEEKNNLHTPIIALTARVLKKEKQMCLKSGMDDCFFKPVSKEVLTDIIKKYLNYPSE